MKAHVSALALTLALLGGCVSLPERTASAPDLPTWTTAGVDPAPVATAWWTALDDPALDAAVARALVHNADLRAAGANLRAARALAGEAQSLRQLQGRLDGSFERTRVAGLSQPPIPGTPERFESQTLASVGGALGWEIDLFGGLEARVDAARANAAAALWARREVEAGVVAGVVQAWIDYRAALTQEELLSARIAHLGSVTDGLRRAADLGGVARGQVEDARAALEQARAEAPLVAAARRNAARRVAALTGEAPVTTLDAGALSASPATLTAGDPAALLRRRPDVAAAERRFAAAAAEARVAVSDLYPRLSLTGAAGLTSAPDRLGDSGAFGFAVGPRLSWGLFDQGRLRQRIVAADARAEAALADWEGTVVRALEEADGALDGWQAARVARQSADSAAEATARRLEIERARAAAGATSRLELQQAEGEAIAARVAAASARADETRAWVAAHLALGAGWRP